MPRHHRAKDQRKPHQPLNVARLRAELDQIHNTPEPRDKPEAPPKEKP